MQKAQLQHTETNKNEYRWGLRKKGKTVYNTCQRMAYCIAIGGALLLQPVTAQANPADGTVVSGAATFTSSGNTLEINQSTARAIIEWGSFDIQAGETTRFIQPSTSAIALNRVVNSTQASLINGNLLANGTVLVINPNGVLIGPGGNIDVAGFIASTADIANDSFMNATATMHFDRAGKPGAVVENKGRITINDAGLGLLVAPTVRNDGVIEGDLARLQMGAGDTFGVDIYGDGLLHLAVSDAAGQREISAENTGRIVASAGKVLMTAAAASDVVSSVINNSGVVEAGSLVSRGGEIILTGAGADVKVSGTLDASGKTGGGTVKIGGEGGGADGIAKAAKVEMLDSAVLKADGTGNGDGGNIAIWSNVATVGRGYYSARGGEEGGNGGFIETSSGNFLDVAGVTIDTSAVLGDYGLWLLDPPSYTIDSVLAATISGATAHVSLVASNDITVAANIDMVNPGLNLSLTAGAGGITMTNNYIRTNNGDVTWYATGALTINNATIFTRGGDVSLTGGSIGINNNAAIGTQGGSVLLEATGTSPSDGVDINSSSVDTTSAGALSIGTLTLLEDGSSVAFADVFNTKNSTLTQTLNGGNLTIIGKDIGKNSVCFALGGVGCTVADPAASIGITVKGDDKLKTYGQTDPTLTYTVTLGALQGTDTFTGGLLRAAGENVGTYAINQGTLAIVQSGSYTYTLTYIPGVFTIDPRVLTITAQDQGKTYGDALALGTTAFTASGLQFSDAISGVTLASAGAAATATVAGSPYAITASAPVFGTGLASNYTIGYAPGALTVSPRALTITASDQSKTYGDAFTFAGTEFTTGTMYNGDTVTSATLASAGAAGSATVAGSTYAITASGAVGTGLSNYTISYVDGAFAVTPRALTITASDQSKTYGDIFTFAGTEFTTGILYNSDTVTSATLASAGAAGSATVAGSTYAITASGAVGTGLSNYTISYVDGAFTVTPRALTITASGQSKTYGDVYTFAGTEFTTGTLYNGDTVTSATLASAGAAGSATVAGSTYAITASGAVGTGLSNYTISYVDGAFTVTPRALTITASDQSKTYGDIFTFAGTEFTTGTMYNGDTVTSATLASAGAAAAATVAGSTYAITASGAVGTGLSNYTISYADGAFTVTPRALTITASDQSKTYGDVFSFAGTEFTTSALYNGDTVTSATLASAGAAAAATVAGSAYAITASGAVGTGLSNYTISYVDGAFAVTPRALTITASDQSKTYGDTFAFAGTEFTTGTMYNGDAVTSATLASAGAAGSATVAGSTYAITASGAVGTGLLNYTISYVDGAFTVTPRALTITANDQSKTYGDVFSFAGTEFTTGTMYNGDTVTSATLGSAGAAGSATVAGSTYAITTSGAVGTGLSNYTISYVDGAFTVTPRALTITASDQSKTYGDVYTFAGTEFTTGTLYNGDTVTSATLASAGAAGSATVAGSTYAITASGAVGTGLSNYDITYVDGAFAVTPRALTITASDQSKTYGDTFTFAGTEFTTGTLYNGDTVTSASLSSTGTPAGAAAGGYDIDISGATGTGLGNYIISYAEGLMSVGQKALVVTANSFGKIYGDIYTFLGTEFTTAGLEAGDSVTSATLASGGAAGTAGVGGYLIDVSGATGFGLSNYTISYAPGLLTVSPRALTITASDQSKTYGDIFTFAGTEFTTGTLYNGDTVTSATLASAGAAGSATVAGSTYAITASGAVGTGLSNYTISYVDGAFTVTPRALTITASDQSKTYGDVFTFAGTEFTTGTMYNGDTVTSATLASAGAAGSATVAGSTYAITASGAVGTGLSNYDITYVDGAFAVTPRALTITASDQSKTYGDIFTFTGAEFTTGTLYNGDTVTSASLSSAGAAATATVAAPGPAYAIDISAAVGTGLSNYDITYAPGTMTVTPRPLTITALDRSKTYGDTYVFGSSDYTIAGLAGGDTMSVVLQSAGAASSATVGGYGIDWNIISGSGLWTTNYNWTFVPGTMTVGPRALTITALDQSKTYGDTFTFAGTEFSTSTLYNGDTVTSATLASAGADSSATVAGAPYAITASGAVGTGLSNYDITYVDGAFAVSPKVLTITANDDSKIYGSAYTFAGTEFSTAGLINGDTVTSATLASAGAAAVAGVGPYAITASGAVGTGLSNYTIGYVDGTLTVTPKALTITADDQIKTYGTLFTFAGTEFTTSGLVNADTVDFAALSSTGSPVPALPGAYPIVIAGTKGVGLSNYDITYVDGTMTIAVRQFAPNFEIDPLGRPIISVADQAIVLDRPFEQIETLTLNTDVGMGYTPGGTSSAQSLAALEPASGGNTPQELASIEPAAGGNGGANDDIACANEFLNNRSCATQAQ